MARTIIGTQEAPGSNSENGLELVFTSADTFNGNRFKSTGKELVLVRNVASGGVSVLFSSVADSFNRLGDLQVNIASGVQMFFGPFLAVGWRDNDGYISLDGNDVGVQFAIVTLFL